MKKSEAYRAAGMTRAAWAYGMVIYMTEWEHAKVSKLSDFAPRDATPEEIALDDGRAAGVERENAAWIERLRTLFAGNEKGSAGVRTPEGGE
jgi:hypothetical protein